MIREKPSRISSLFNVNYYSIDGGYIKNTGNQRLKGKLTLNSEVVYGDEIVHGESTMRDEPTVLSISAPSQLNNNNLVTKSYTDYKILHPESEPFLTNVTPVNDLSNNHLVSKSYVDYTNIRPVNEPVVTTLLASNLLTDNHLVSKSYVDYTNVRPVNEPVVTTPLLISALTNNHLVTKKYVNDLNTANEIAANLYPTSFSLGKSYSSTNATFTLQIESGMVYVKFKTLDYKIYTTVFDIEYYINRSPPNNFIDTYINNSKTSLWYSAKYLVNWFYNGSWWENTTHFHLLDGSIIHQNYGFNGGETTIKFVTFGLYNGKPSIQVGFPNQYINTINKDGWVSSYGISIKLAASQPNLINQGVTETSNNPGIAYFDKYYDD